MYNKVKKEQEKQKTNLTKERNKRCLPAARKVLEITGRGKIEDKEAPELQKSYADLYRETMDVFMEHDIKITEVGYVFRLVRLSADLLEDTVNQSLTRHLETAQEKAYGKRVDELTIQDLDELVKAE